jgi:glycosyltransferase A (GT-A) superfamily protein (DUF2064 family)
MSAHVLVVAKAPVPGEVKTRLATRIGDDAAADVAAAALLDTLDACVAAFGPDCHLALSGDLDHACRGDEIRDALRGWHLHVQHGDSFGDRLAHAHHTVAAASGGPVVQIASDTPQVTAGLLRDAAFRLHGGAGVIGPAVDGGWWLLGLSVPGAADALARVAMSTPRTAFDTRRALAGWGVRLATTRTLRDVDTVDDADLVAAAAPATRFADAWAHLGTAVR